MTRTAEPEAPTDASIESGRSLRWGFARAIGPIVFFGAVGIRSFRPVFDPTLFGILLVLGAVIVALLAGRRWAALAIVPFPLALLASPAGNELSFNLSSYDSLLWRWHGVVALLSAGLSLGTAVVVGVGRIERRQTTVGLVVGAACGLGLVPVVQAMYDHPAFGSSLTSAERAELPRHALLSYAFAPVEIEVEPDEIYRAVLVNPSDLPHTVTIDELDLEVYVPARREAVLELDARLLDGSVGYYCSIGEHEELGMVGVVTIFES